MRRRAVPGLLLILAVIAPVLAQRPAPRAPEAGSPQASLTRAADALLALKSARFSLTREGTPAFLDQKTGVTFTTADCLYAAPDRVSCNIKVALKGGTIVQLTRVWVPEGTFQSNPLTKQFAKLPPDSSFDGNVLFARAGIPGVLRTAVQKAQTVGREKIGGRDTLHVKGEVSGKRLSPLMGGTVRPELTYPVDLWMDAASAVAVQFHIAEPGNNGWLIVLSGANEPVAVPTPPVPATAPRPPA
ncbi:MAG: LppX_LprAFG lipoprotein [Vicinamibacterales bacterium]